MISTYDKAVLFRTNDGKLARVVLVHVDDLLGAGSEDFKSQASDPFKMKFKVSIESESCFKYVGLEIK